MGLVKGKNSSHKFDSNIWSIVFGSKEEIIVEVRDHSKQNIQFFKLVLSGKIELLKNIKVTQWMTRLVGYQDGKLYFQIFKSKDDPGLNSLIAKDIRTGLDEDIKELPLFKTSIDQPYPFDQGTEYFEKLNQFLGGNLLHFVEYYEIGEKIFVSFYKQEELSLSRYLGFINNGVIEKIIRQDFGMKGVANNAFCIFENHLVFIKDANEICTYQL